MTTKMTAAAVACLAVLILAASAQAQVPRVIETWPQNGAMDVDPAIAEIRVTFSQDMEKAFSFDKGTGEFPAVSGQPRWSGSRTIALSVKLKPETAYEILVNSESYRNFRSLSGVPAEPLVWTFTTRGLVRKAFRTLPETERLALNAEAWQEFERALQTCYAHRDLKRIDWSARANTYRKKAVATADAGEWAAIVVDMLKVTRDPHVRVENEGKSTPVYVPTTDRSWNDRRTIKAFETYKDINPIVAVGRKPNGVAYVAVKALEADKAGDLAVFDSVMKDLADAKFLILDLRLCGDGSPEQAAKIAGWFTDQPRPYCKISVRDITANGGWTPAEDLVLEPAGEGRYFSKPVFALSSRKLMSGAELLVMMLKECPNVTVAGDSTYGCYGGERPLELCNGVTVYLPAVKAMLLDGSCYEAIGVHPDIYVNLTDAADSLTDDPVVKKALEKSQEHIWK